MFTSLAYRRRVLGTNKCNREGDSCPKIVYFKSTNGTMYSGNTIIKGSEFAARRQYAQLVNRLSSRPIYWTSVIIRNNINKFGSSIGSPYSMLRSPPTNF